MQRDAERVDRLTTTIGGDLFAALVEELTAIGHAVSIDRACLEEVAQACRRGGMPPEDMLIAVRHVSRSLFARSSAQGMRVEDAWHPAVRRLMNAYYKLDLPT